MEMVDHATKYATKYGWAVFPCIGKLPATPHGFKDASKDPDLIKKMFSMSKDFNIAIATGKISGIFVLDIDVKNSAGGDESLAQLEKEFGVLPNTPMVITPSKGVHYYFKYPTHFTIGCRTGIRPGIDVRGDGGYVIAPPSKGYDFEVMHGLN